MLSCRFTFFVLLKRSQGCSFICSGLTGANCVSTAGPGLFVSALSRRLHHQHFLCPGSEFQLHSCLKHHKKIVCGWKCCVCVSLSSVPSCSAEFDGWRGHHAWCPGENRSGRHGEGFGLWDQTGWGERVLSRHHKETTTAVSYFISGTDVTVFADPDPLWKPHQREHVQQVLNLPSAAPHTAGVSSNKALLFLDLQTIRQLVLLGLQFPFQWNHRERDAHVSCENSFPYHSDQTAALSHPKSRLLEAITVIPLFSFPMWERKRQQRVSRSATRHL